MFIQRGRSCSKMISNMKYLILITLITLVLIENVQGGNNNNKYSKEANNPTEDTSKLFSKLEKPFRMSKINILWSKAQLRLTETKLKSLYSELKLHDKEEITWKKLKMEGKDKDGLKEAQLRKKLLDIMALYGLLEHFEDNVIRAKQAQHSSFNEASDDHINKSLFKDKKLNKLWDKAEVSGFTTSELNALKEEFNHHQDKIDEYYSILSELKTEEKNDHENSVDYKLEKFNSLSDEDPPKKDNIQQANLLRERHRDIRDGYDRLHRLAAKGPNSKEFIEPKVQGLWKIALETNFTVDELDSLKTELLHYENRLLKLRHLHAEAAIHENREKENIKISGGKSDGMDLLQDNIKKQARKVEKIHLDLETRIMQKHIEL